MDTEKTVRRKLVNQTSWISFCGGWRSPHEDTIATVEKAPLPSRLDQKCRYPHLLPAVNTVLSRVGGLPEHQALSDPSSCSLLRFFVRAIPHWLFFTPKPVFFPTPTHNRPYLSSIEFANSFCAFLHIILSRPEAGEAARGYLHGGLLIDFVGELGPVSKWRLLLFDIFILLLQVLMLGATLEKRDMKLAMSNMGYAEASGNRETSTRQDLDAEEQGIRRSQDGNLDGPGLSASHTEEMDEAFEASNPRDEHYLDAYYGGQFVIFNFHVVETIRMAWIRRYDILARDATDPSFR